MSSPDTTPPKAVALDHVATALRIGVNLVPIAGGSLAEMVNLSLGPPLERRRTKWIEAVAKKLEAIELRFDELTQDERFVSVFVMATLAAMKTHQEAKLASLRNAVVNSVVGATLDETTIFAFIRYIDELTPDHSLILKFLCEHSEQIATLDGYEPLFKVFAGIHGSILSKELFRLLCRDLENRTLIRVSEFFGDLDGIYTTQLLATSTVKSTDPRIMVTESGRKFLIFMKESHGNTPQAPERSFHA